MKGLDLSTFEDQQQLLWIPTRDGYVPGERFTPRTFAGGRQGDPHTYRIRRENLDCRLGGAKHRGWEDWGRDWTNHGEAGIVEVDVHVCVNCGRDKR
jgi:hypothetical protein